MPTVKTCKVNLHGKEYEVTCTEKLDADGERIGWTCEMPESLEWVTGRGSHLKPMFEPIVLARAPRHPYTFAQLAQQFGSGALNVDGGRIGTDEETRRNSQGGDNGLLGTSTFKIRERRVEDQPITLGRFPGNVALVHTDTCTADGCAAECAIRLLDEMTPDRTSKATGGGDSPSGERHVYDGGWKPIRSELPDDNGGGASRFFYTAKSSTFERTAGLPARSSHPTLKPIQLIEWLSTLLLPPKLDTPRRLLVPFAGVASEMIGAYLAGWDVVHGIEQSAAYIAEGKQRAAWWSKYDSYDKAAASYAVLQEVKQEEAARKAANVEQLRLFGEDVA